MINSVLIDKLRIGFAQSKYFRVFFDLLLLIWVVWVLFPLLDTGLMSDDAYNSQIAGTIITYGVTLWERLWSEIVGWAVGAGRIYPLNYMYLYTFYYFEPSVLLVKSITLSIICIDILLFSTIIRTLTRSRNLGYLCAFLVPLFFQFRFWHDPILGFTFLMPLMCMFLFLSILLLLKYLEKKENSYLVYFIILYLVSMLTYEITYAFVFVYIPILFFRSNRKGSIKFVLIVLFLTFSHFFLGKYIYLDRLVTEGTSTYPGYNLNLDLIGVIHALYIQVTSALPLSWKFANAPFHQKFYQIGVENLIAYAAFATLFCTALFKFDRSSLDKQTLYKIITFSFFALMAPALAMAVSGHQKELIDAGFGYGYTPVFIQYFGACVLILFLLLFIKDRYSSPNHKRILFVLFWLVVFSVGAITREENILVVEESNKFYKYPRVLLGDAIDRDLLNEVSEKDLILRNERYPSDYYWFYSMKTNKKLNVCGLNIGHQFPHCLSESYEIAQGLTCSTCKKETIANSNSKLAISMKEVIKTKFEQGASRKEILNYFVKEYGKNVLLKTPHIGKGKLSKSYGLSYFLGENYRSGSVLIAEIDDVVLIEEIPIQLLFKNFKIYNSYDQSITMHSSEKEYDFLKVTLLENDLTSKSYDLSKFYADDISIGYKDFHLREGDTKNYLRWSSGDSTLIIFNKTKSLVKTEINFNLIRPTSKNKKPAVITITDNKNTYIFKVDRQENVNLSLNIKPGTNYIEFRSDAPPVDNGDPRNIVFGIGNYRLDTI